MFESIVQKAISEPSDSVILYGSYARGDQNDTSDIDFLVVASKRKATFSIKNVSVTTYTKEQLLNMANEGSLFICHIVNEGKEIYGKNIIPTLAHNLKLKEDYSLYRDTLRECSQLLMVNRIDYKRSYRNLHLLKMYIIRSFIFSLIVETKKINFSKNNVTKFIPLEMYKSLENARNNPVCNYQDYYDRLTDVLLYLKVEFEEKASLEAEIVNSYKKNKLVYILGIRLLNTNRKLIEY